MNYEKRLKDYISSINIENNRFIKYIKILKEKINNITK